MRKDDERAKTKGTSVVALNEEVPVLRRRIGSLTNCREEQLQYTKITRYEDGQGGGDQLDATAHNEADCYNPQRQGAPSEDYYGDRIIAEEGMWTTFEKVKVLVVHH